MYKLFIKVFFLIFILGLSGITLLNFTIDPLQYYRYSPDKPFYESQRWQIAGFIRSFSFDQIILGTSLTENFSMKMIGKTLGTQPIKLSASGLPIQEQTIILNTAIKTGKVKSVIWGIDRNFLNYQSGKLQNSFPASIYKQNLQGHLIYLWNISTTKLSFKYLRPWKRHKGIADFDEYHFWHKEAKYSKENILASYQGSLNNVSQSNQQDPQKKSEFMKKITQRKLKNFNDDVLKVIRDNPQVQFHIFYPPYSLAHYKLEEASKTFAEDAYLRRTIIEKLSKLPNVAFYDFETDLNIVANLDNFRDLQHYSKEINDYMIFCIRDKKNIITTVNLESHNQKFMDLPKKEFKE